MKKMLLFAVLFLVLKSIAQNPKREFRGAWVTTVSNIDWPSRTATPQQQRDAFINILNTLQNTGINAVLVQVRGNADAIYPSSIEPWSDVLTGTQGRAPSPAWDPLEFMITECKKRGMEFHAWFNPYRAVSNVTNITLAANHIAVTRPDLLLAQGNLRILDPGKFEALDHIIKVVMDVVRRYDIDGVHFDDYFYPYPPTAPTAPFDDAATFASNSRGITNINDWRRANIDSLIKRTRDSIKAAKPWVKYGISPFGIWRNGTSVGGSNTSGLQSFSAIYANSRLWQQNQWIDYQMPQIYWSIGFAAANYAELVSWWNSNANGRHIYAGHGIYKIQNDADANWNNNTQTNSQVRLNRTLPNVLGSCFFSTATLFNNPLNVRDSLQARVFNTKSLMPAMTWLDNTAPPAPVNLTNTVIGTNVTLNWTAPTTANTQFDRARQYVVYRSTTGTVNINDPANIRAITPVDSTNFTEIGLTPGVTYTYLVTALDRMHNESVASNTVNVTVNATNVQTLSALVAEIKQNAPNPFTNQSVISYRLHKPMNVSIAIYDLQGRLIETLFNGNRIVGEYNQVIDGEKLSAGKYTVLFSTKEGQKAISLIKQ